MFHDSVAHLMRTGNFTTPRSASRSPSVAPGSAASPDRQRRPSSSAASSSPSWIDIIALNDRERSRTSATVLPLTAADIIEAEDWEIEQPWPPMRDVGHHGVVALGGVVELQVDDDLVAAQRVEALGPCGGRHLQLPAVPRAAVVVEDDLSVEVFEVRHAVSAVCAAVRVSDGVVVGAGFRRRRSRPRLEGIGEGVDVVGVVVHVPRCPGGGTDSKHRMSGLAQWWPGRTHTPCWLSTWDRSWGWMPR